MKRAAFGVVAFVMFSVCIWPLAGLAAQETATGPAVESPPVPGSQEAPPSGTDQPSPSAAPADGETDPIDEGATATKEPQPIEPTADAPALAADTPADGQYGTKPAPQPAAPGSPEDEQYGAEPTPGTPEDEQYADEPVAPPVSGMPPQSPGDDQYETLPGDGSPEDDQHETAPPAAEPTPAQDCYLITEYDSHSGEVLSQTTQCYPAGSEEPTGDSLGLDCFEAEKVGEPGDIYGYGVCPAYDAGYVAADDAASTARAVRHTHQQTQDNEASVFSRTSEEAGEAGPLGFLNGSPFVSEAEGAGAPVPVGPDLGTADQAPGTGAPAAGVPGTVAPTQTAAAPSAPALATPASMAPPVEGARGSGAVDVPLPLGTGLFAGATSTGSEGGAPNAVPASSLEPRPGEGDGPGIAGAEEATEGSRNGGALSEEEASGGKAADRDGAAVSAGGDGGTPSGPAFAVAEGKTATGVGAALLVGSSSQARSVAPSRATDLVSDLILGGGAGGHKDGREDDASASGGSLAALLAAGGISGALALGLSARARAAIGGRLAAGWRANRFKDGP